MVSAFVPATPTFARSSYVSARASCALRSRFNGARVALAPGVVTAARVNMKIGIYFATSTGNTTDMADNIKEALGDKADDPVDLGDDGFSPDQFKSHEMIFVGAPTWNTDQEESRTGTEWDDVMQDGLPSLDGTPVAIFGLGDSTGYADYFCDAIEELHDNFQKAGAKMVGYTPDNVYPGISSKSIRDGKFLGCPIDVIEAEPDADERIISWAAQAVGEAGL